MAEMAERYQVLPRAGGLMDQDPLELTQLRIAAGVFDEKREQERQREEAKARKG
jgi:hypothetical protein